MSSSLVAMELFLKSMELLLEKDGRLPILPLHLWRWVFPLKVLLEIKFLDFQTFFHPFTQFSCLRSPITADSLPWWPSLPIRRFSWNSTSRSKLLTFSKLSQTEQHQVRLVFGKERIVCWRFQLYWTRGFREGKGSKRGELWTWSRGSHLVQ